MYSTKENLFKAKKSIEARIKLIKLADKSDNGWSTASEYVTDDLVDNSDDDNKIHTEKSFRNLIKSTRNQIIFTIF